MKIFLLEPANDAVTDADVQRLVPTWPAGGNAFLKAYDPEIGLASLVVTQNKDEALEVEDPWALWHSVPSAHPIRTTDGKPNRPLTGFNIMVVR